MTKISVALLLFLYQAWDWHCQSANSGWVVPSSFFSFPISTSHTSSCHSSSPSCITSPFSYHRPLFSSPSFSHVTSSLLLFVLPHSLLLLCSFSSVLLLLYFLLLFFLLLLFFVSFVFSTSFLFSSYLLSLGYLPTCNLFFIMFLLQLSSSSCSPHSPFLHLLLKLLLPLFF